MISEA